MNLLKYINSLPVSFTMKHYQVFDAATPHMKNQALTSIESWEVLRTEHPFFSIPDTREEWLRTSEVKIKKDGQDNRLIERAKEVVDLLTREQVTQVFSVGVGGAALEYQIKKAMPQVRMICSDYSPQTVHVLKQVFTECDEIVQFDIEHDNWNTVQEEYLGEKGICLMYRVDAGVSDEAWHRIFRAMSKAGIKKILVIPTGALTLLSIYNRKKRELKWLLKRVPVIWSGYVRTKKRFKGMWQLFYADLELSLGGLTSFLLTKKGVVSPH